MTKIEAPPLFQKDNLDTTSTAVSHPVHETLYRLFITSISNRNNYGSSYSDSADVEPGRKTPILSYNQDSSGKEDSDPSHKAYKSPVLRVPEESYFSAEDASDSLEETLELPQNPYPSDAGPGNRPETAPLYITLHFPHGDPSKAYSQPNPAPYDNSASFHQLYRTANAEILSYSPDSGSRHNVKVSKPSDSEPAIYRVAVYKAAGYRAGSNSLVYEYKQPSSGRPRPPILFRLSNDPATN